MHPTSTKLCREASLRIHVIVAIAVEEETAAIGLRRPSGRADGSDGLRLTTNCPAGFPTYGSRD
jgi:hypothetical protein